MVATCKAGLCDVTGGQCDNCVSDSSSCTSPSEREFCSSDGQTLKTETCAAPTALCKDGKCVECLAATDCAPTANECEASSCSADGVCGTVPVAQGASCGAASDPGHCNGSGQCEYCSPGAVRCTGATPQTCNAAGQWESGSACVAPAAICQAGACVQCTSEANCPASTNPCQVAACSAGGTCGFTPVANGTACSGGTCNGAGVCSVCTPGSATCNGATPLTCNASGLYESGTPCAGSTPVCDQNNGQCVQCMDVSQCTASSNPCLVTTCTGNTCGLSNVSQGTACSGGACNGSGQCWACTPSTTRCKPGVGNQPEICSATGQWQDETTCAGTAAICTAGQCVECTDAAQCTVASECLVPTCNGNTCGATPKAVDTSCSGGAGKCNGAGQCNLCPPGISVCSGNGVLTCDAQGQYNPIVACASPKPYCETASSACVECTAAAQCPAANECITATCAANACGTTPKAVNTACMGGAGKCDGAGQCNLCTPNTSICNGNVPLVCGANGQYTAQPACSGATPNCDSSTGICVQCSSAGQCPSSSNACLNAVCASNACTFAPKPQGTVCAGGTCSVTGVCQACTPGTVSCSGNGVLTCNSSGQYDPIAGCVAPKPYCDGTTTSCVECTAAAQCATPNDCFTPTCTGKTCGAVPKAVNTGCSGGAGKCDGAGQCNLCTPNTSTCSGNGVLTCNALGQYNPIVACASPKPYCETASSTCVECTAAGQCPASNECITATCAANACGTTPKALNTACMAGSGKCDGAGQCNLCTPGTAMCNGNIPLVCGANGQYTAQPACSGATPNCNAATGTCVQCSSASQCPSSSNPCLNALCSSNTCTFAPKPQGTVCAGGTCSVTGVCQACTPGTVSCSGNGVLTCNSGGQYDPIASCVAPMPYCDATTTSCVACTLASQCTPPANTCQAATCTGNACGVANKTNGTACAVGTDTGTCTAGNCRVCVTGATRCKSGVTNTVQTCDANGLWQDTVVCSGGTPYCVGSGTCGVSDCTAIRYIASQVPTLSSALSYPASWTIEGWARVPTLPSAWGTLIGVDAVEACAGMNKHWYIAVDPDGTISAWLAGTGTASTTKIAANTWFHFAMQFASSGVGTLYINGVLARTASNSQGTWPTGCKMHLGNTQGSFSHFMGAHVASLRYSSGVRYSSTFAAPPVVQRDASTTWLVGFDEQTGTVAQDASTGAAWTLGGGGWLAAGPGCP